MVQEFLERAKRVFEGAEDGLTSADIRHKVFPLVSKEGFATKDVDEALWRLEEAFADKERLSETEAVGEENYYKDVRERAQEILDRAARQAKLDALKEAFIHRHTLLLEGSNHRFGLQSSENSRNVEALKVLQTYNNELEAKISIMGRRVRIVEVEIDIKPPVAVDDPQFLDQGGGGG